ncbi:hypothetical protein Val02_09090 [Virgisporangium aliadipatigenens]|uniref:N-acetyltransferase domain-containing protein n=1 Tax=Virgisporangium aliadipatigenens TaxID=741659 RepID=A0A8J4DNX1_9ACTN|nr:GNAT family N-acetyltransferase [Virgisporangium aliadipatigenens]GIJ44023.1 hypothetical protein Val02_09090 [Virgisporangium aliadipatigenens]
MTDPQLSGRMERIEAEAIYRLGAAASGPTRTALGVAANRYDDGVSLSVREDPSRYWSKTLGFTAPVSAGTIDRVLEFYREQRNPMAILQIAPHLLPPDWDEIRAARGITSTSRPWLKLSAPVDALRPDFSTELRVAAVPPADAHEWATVLLRGFGMDASLVPLFAASAGHDGFRPFAAWDGAEMVAAANVFTLGDTAALCGASTLPAHRGRGAQTALLAARAAAAAERGCDLLVAETYQPGADGINPSLTNLRRLGLSVSYTRPNWLWRQEPDEAAPTAAE